MAEQHRATDSEWYCLEARTSGSKSDVVAYSCILELRDRIRALEAAQQAHADASHVIDPEREKAAQEFRQAAGFAPRWSEFERCAAIIDSLNEAEPTYYLYDKPADSPPQPNHLEIPGGSLVQRVAAVIDNGAACDRAPERIARDSIREVAAWLISNPDHHAPPALVFASEQEAER